MLWCSSQGLKNVRVGLFCHTYNELWERQISKVCIEFPEWLGSYNGEHEEFRFSPAFGSHVISFCNMQKLDSYQSAEFGAIAVDEITLEPDRAVMTLLSGSLRWPGLDWCPFFAATNPTGPGHAWVKKLWIAKDFTGDEDERLDPDDFNFVQCLPRDNPHLSDEYIEKELGRLPDHLRSAWLDGSWEILAGQRFDKFRRHVHVVKPFDLRELGPVEFYRSIDYGTKDPMCCGWYGVVNVDGKVRTYKIQEHLETGLDSRGQAKRVLDRTPSGWPIVRTYLDTGAWGEYEHGLSMADTFMQILGFGQVHQALKDRPAGWDALARAIDWAPGKNLDGTVDLYKVEVEPALYIFDTCPATIQQIEDAMWDPRKGTDIIDTRRGGSHQDALHETRYFVLSRLYPPRADAPSTWEEQQKAIWAAMQKTSRRRRPAVRSRSVYHGPGS